MSKNRTEILKNIHVEFLLEETSMENFLIEILPNILPEGYQLNANCFLRPHEGKSDLKKSIPKKIRVFSNYHQATKIIIVQDQDSKDCKVLKKAILEQCHQNGDCPVLVRLSCRELENWYLGDMDAIEKVYPKFKANSYKNRAKFRIVDECLGSVEMKRIIKDFQKGYASKNIPKFMNVNTNKSVSFNHFVSGIKRFLSNDN